MPFDGATAGAFPFAAGSRDAASIATLSPGAYTATVTGAAGGTGIALVEVYDLDPNGQSRLSSLSTRAEAGRGAQALVAGFYMSGAGSGTYRVRAAGPGLAGYGIKGCLGDPTLQVVTAGVGTLLDQNDNWNDYPDQTALAAFMKQAFAFSFADKSKDSALLTTRTSGGYTAAVVPADGKSSGVALVEVYASP